MAMAMANADSPLHHFQICGVPVHFPYKPYGPQLAFMGKVLAALEQSRSSSSSSSSINALLESPTGSGKTLALLCATLAWQSHFQALPPLPPPPNAPPDPLLAGGGFIVDPADGGVDTPITGRNTHQRPKKRKVPIIYYASRTHTQITQVIREFRKTKYRVPMAVLGARKHYCTNRHVAAKNNVDEDCKLLLKDEQRCCPQFKNVLKLKMHPSLQKGGSNDVHDIEDLVGLGHKVKGCAYFAARALATEADIVFCPYSYILDPIIRNAMEVNLQGAIVVLDEAHNIEDVAREAGSIDLDTTLLQDLRLELEQLATSDETANIYSPLLEMVQGLLDWTYHHENSLTKLDFEHYASSWRGAKALQELRTAGICLGTFEVLIACSNKAVGAASNPDETLNHLSGRAAIAIEGLFSALKFMLLDNGRRAGDYQLVVKRFVKRDEGLGVAGWVTTVSLWCLNPGVVFEEIASAARSIILTSGTLSPMDSFASELGVPFQIQMEAPHIVDMDKQVWAAAVSMGPDNVSLNASYKNADGYGFQDALGIVLEEVFKVVPDGALTFFPSYKLLDKLCARWKSTGQWQRLSNEKELFVEPRGNNDQFELVLQDFYNAVNTKKQPPDRNRKGADEKRQDLKRRNTSVSRGRRAGGAAFLAVCRGKVSEGIDFADKNARIVVIVGIPFPNVKDIQVTLKKQYNQENRLHKNLLTGDQWYCQQTFRALNQAVGRCIRHRNDYGAILLLDDRFKKSENIQYMSKWLRKSIRQFESFRESLEGLRTFFKRFETSPDVVKDLTITPTVKSTLISAQKAKLSVTPTSVNHENQRTLTGYITEAHKDSAVLQDVTSRQPPAKDPIVNKKGSHTGQLFPLRQSRSLVEPRTRQTLGIMEARNTEIAGQTDRAVDVDEDQDSDYEIFSVQNDHILWDETAISDVQIGIEDDYNRYDKVIVADDILASTKPTQGLTTTATTHNHASELTSLVETNDKRSISGEGLGVCGGQLKNQSEKRKLATMESPHEGASIRYGDSLQGLSSVKLETPVKCSERQNIGAKIDERHVRVWRHDENSPSHRAKLDLKVVKDAEPNSCLDVAEGNMECSHVVTSDSYYYEVPRHCRQEEDTQAANIFQIKDSTDLIQNCNCDGYHGRWFKNLNSENSLDCIAGPSPQIGSLSNSSSHYTEQEDGQPSEDSKMRSRNNLIFCSNSKPFIDLHFRQEASAPDEVEADLPCVTPPGEPGTSGHLDPEPGLGRLDCGNRADRLTSGSNVSCSGKTQHSLEAAIFCERCSCPFSTSAEVIRGTFSKSYLATLYNGVCSGAKVPMLLMEFDALHSLVKERLSSSNSSTTLSPIIAAKRSPPYSGVWIREDGCVYEHIFCPRCEDPNTCVGVHIAACDKVNVLLINKAQLESTTYERSMHSQYHIETGGHSKVLFFERHLKVTTRRRVELEQNKAAKSQCRMNSFPQVPTTQGAHPASTGSRAETSAKAKLKLQRTKF